MQRIVSPSNRQARVGKLRDSQIATRDTWTAVPDRDVQAAAMHVIRVRPTGSTTVTRLNPMDPGTIAGTDGSDDGPGWLDRPGADGTLYPAGRR